jgi:hypothetical protein
MGVGGAVMFKLMKYDLRYNYFSILKRIIFSILIPFILFRWVPFPADKALTVMLILQWGLAWGLLIKAGKTAYHHLVKVHIRLLPIRPIILFISPILAFILMFILMNFLFLTSFAISSDPAFYSQYAHEVMTETILLFLGSLYALIIGGFSMITATTIFSRKKMAMPAGIILFILLFNAGNWIVSAVENFTRAAALTFHYPLLQKLFGGQLSPDVNIAVLPYLIILCLVFYLIYVVSQRGINLEE